jgi:hypothetical protein
MISRTQVGEFLGANKPRSKAVLEVHLCARVHTCTYGVGWLCIGRTHPHDAQAYLATFDDVIAREGFMPSLRAFMESFRVPVGGCDRC